MTGGWGKRVVALYGYPGSGKDTVAQFLVERGGWTRVAFADQLRKMLLALDPIVCADDEGHEYRLSEWSNIEDAKRNEPEVRRLLQVLGTEAGRCILGEDVWVNAAMTSILTALDAGNRVVVTDTRFPNEYRAMCDLGALIVEVRRPGYEACNGHDSEKHYGEFLPNYVLHNDLDLPMLRATVDMLVRDAKLE